MAIASHLEDLEGLLGPVGNHLMPYTTQDGHQDLARGEKEKLSGDRGCRRDFDSVSESSRL